MKNFLKMAGYTLATLMVLFVSQSSALAADGSSNTSSMSGIQVFGGFVVLALVILLPLLKAEKKDRIA